MAVEQRIGRVRALMRDRGYDALVIRNNPDLRWLTGAARVFDFENAHTAFITADKLYFHTDSRYYNTFLERMGADHAWQFDEEWVGHPQWIVERILESKSRVVGIEDTLSLKFFSDLMRQAQDRSVPLLTAQIHDDLVRMRSVKDEQEIEIMRKAQAITDKAFAHMCEYIQVGMTEKQIQAELEGFMYAQGADALAFDSIVATGPNTANPHALPGQARVEAGHFVLMDYGAAVDDYKSDMTRTVVMGNPTDEQRLIYDTVRRANEECTKIIKPGCIGKEVHAKAVEIITEAGYGDKFQHGLGHGVGIEIHELPNFNRASTDVFEIGNVVTNEPGIYLPGFGGVRIEDYGVLTENGFELFTQSTHELQIL